MTRKIDWSRAASLPPPELDRLLDLDHDEVDDNLEARGEELAAARRVGGAPGGGRAVRVRPAVEGDADAVSALILRTLEETNARDYPPQVIARVQRSFTPSAVRDMIARRRVTVAVAGDRILGTASLDGGTVRTVFVAPDAQRRGIGTQLMAEVKRTARESGLATVMVPSSLTAERFYAKLGFEAVRDMHHGEERTIVMECALDP